MVTREFFLKRLSKKTPKYKLIIQCVFMKKIILTINFIKTFSHLCPVSALIAIPIAVYFDVKQFEFGPVCIEDWPNKQYMYPAYGLFTVIVLYVIPLFIIVVCYVSMLRTLWRTSLPGK